MKKLSFEIRKAHPSKATEAIVNCAGAYLANGHGITPFITTGQFGQPAIAIDLPDSGAHFASVECTFVPNALNTPIGGTVPKYELSWIVDPGSIPRTACEKRLIRQVRTLSGVRHRF